MSYDLICGDCCKEMRKITADSFDAAITSPPYNIGIKYRAYTDKKPEEVYLDWLVEWSTEIHRLLQRDGSFFLNITGSHRMPWMPFEAVARLRKIFVLQNTFHWIKAISLDEDTSAGHFKPVNSDRFVTSCHEFVFQFTKHGKAKLDRLSLGVKYADKTNIKRWKHTAGRDLRCRGNVWFIPYPTIQHFKDRPHPAIFPPQLAEYCIKIARAKSVIDPFVGIGNTGVAAKRCRVTRFLGIDIDQTYLDQARENLVL
jgi:site-specific DNA-methyltransferase (adenine-specific)